MDKAKHSIADKRQRLLYPATVSLALWLSACGGGGGGDDSSSATPQATEDWQRDILLTSLTIDLEAMQGSADIQLAGSTRSSGVSFESGDLIIAQVTANGLQLNYRNENGALHIGIPPSSDDVTLSIDYSLNLQSNFDGLLDGGMSFTWPYHCGNLFPCKSEPAEGSGYELQINGAPASSEAIYPASIINDAPAYMLAWVVGDYAFSSLGTTSAGTEVGVYYPAELQQQALDGSRYLRDVFDWYERTYGPYPFGQAVASVSVDWGPGEFGGMEHHPFWHIASSAISDPWVHVHEAAHGWFGNGVRIACWEDFVLSEGLASYLTARAISAIAGEAPGDEVWTSYGTRLAQLQQSSSNKIAWPSGCQQIDILQDGLFGTAPYMKGAFFFRHLEFSLGVDLLDRILREFFLAYVGTAATMDDFLQLVEQRSGYDPEACAIAWLRSEAVPSGDNCAYQ
ncbi:MAG: M1 family aminopeptidase [Candidatus Thiodiazotropha taylori]|nr:peptidase M1 [Candidatus Thiodiazotropha taylori]MCW4328148.1 M1 family aminopeptidase [Candidatus Thiodiazotropha taylori]